MINVMIRDLQNEANVIFCDAFQVSCTLYRIATVLSRILALDIISKYVIFVMLTFLSNALFLLSVKI